MIRLWELGGVGVACKNIDREFIGIEIDEKYYKIAEERMSVKTEPETQLSIFDLYN